MLCIVSQSYEAAAAANTARDSYENIALQIATRRVGFTYARLSCRAYLLEDSDVAAVREIFWTSI